MPKRNRFIVVDDHPLYRTGVGALVQQELGLEFSGEAASLQDALSLVARGDPPDLAIVDISLRDENGLSLVATLKSLYPNILVLVVSMHDETLYGERAIKAGARGYVMKHQPPEELVEAVSLVLRGNIAVSDALKTRLVESVMAGNTAVDPVASLSGREFDVFGLIGKGYGAAEIANALCLSVKTINTHQDHIKRKLNLSSAAELRRFALEWESKKK